MNTQFLEAIFVDSIQHPNFFNGRILTATDLRDEQTANLRRSHYLGQALGTGVVSGLQVTINSADNSALEITGGLAINPKGETLALPVAQTTRKLTITNQLIASSSSSFFPCSPPAATTSTGLIATNYYLLAITSATKFSDTGNAPHSGLGTSNNRCTSRYEEIGIKFKLIPLNSADVAVIIDANDLKNRSRLAHLCFGTYDLNAFTEDPIHAPTQYGLIHTLRTSKKLTDCDVPLALFQYQSQQLQFVDMWAVRRPCRQEGTDSAWGNPAQSLVGDRRMLEGKSFLLQFQQQLADIQTNSGTNIRAIDHFEYLPAVGYLPAEIATATFFAETNYSQISLDQTQLLDLFQKSFSAPPIVPSTTEIEVYPVLPATDQDPYLVFLRRGLLTTNLINRGNCTYTLTPANWEASLTQIANGVDDIHICFQAGTYNLTRPIKIQNKGHIKITGAGKGTRLISNNAETALHFASCQSVTVRDLYAQNSTAKFPNSTQRLNGVLSFYDCPEVLVTNATLKCIGNSTKTATCITVSPIKQGEHQLSAIRSIARIENCNLEVGDRQIGILLINTDYAQVNHNRVITLQAVNPSIQGIVVAGSIAKDVKITNNTVQNTLQGIHIGVSHHETSVGSPDLIDNLVLQGNTVHISLPNISRRIVKTRHGIFVGNCNSLVIENNYITLTRFNSSANLLIDGIKIFGTLGDRIIIRQNHLTGTNDRGGFSGEGINFTNLQTSPSNPLIENNFING